MDESFVNQTNLDKEIEDLIVKMHKIDPASDEYKSMAENLKILNDARLSQRRCDDEVWRGEQDLELRKQKMRDDSLAAAEATAQRERDSKRNFWGRLIMGILGVVGGVFSYFAGDILGKLRNNDFVKGLQSGKF